MRKTSVRSVIDPNNTLPHVELRQRRTAYGLAEGIGGRAIYLADTQVGELKIDRREAQYLISSIIIDPEKRGIGLGLASHVTAIEEAHAQNNAFRNGNPLSPPSFKIWQLFIEAGVAEVFTPFERIGLMSYRGIETPAYRGKAVIHPCK